MKALFSYIVKPQNQKKMKKSLLIATIIAFALMACEENNDENTTIPVSIEMGPSYAEDVYYSMTDGVVKKVDRTNWDIAFHTDSWSSTIILNEGNDVKLFTYRKGDTTAWNNNFTEQDIAQQEPLYNADTSWTHGAFEQNSLGHPDYGWGIYNMQSHDVIGDSLFVIQLGDGSFKKLWIKRKNSTENNYVIKYADLDGTSEMEKNIDASAYTGKNFIYYSLQTDEVLDREPDSESWDILFTKYVGLVPSSEGMTPYNLTGVLANIGIQSAEIRNTDPAIADYKNADFNTNIAEIGADWKSFDMETFSWSLENNVSYFVETSGGNIYKMVFTSYEGQSTGVIGFEKTRVK